MKEQYKEENRVQNEWGYEEIDGISFAKVKEINTRYSDTIPSIDYIHANAKDDIGGESIHVPGKNSASSFRYNKSSGLVTYCDLSPYGGVDNLTVVESKEEFFEYLEKFVSPTGVPYYIRRQRDGKIMTERMNSINKHYEKH